MKLRIPISCWDTPKLISRQFYLFSSVFPLSVFSLYSWLLGLFPGIFPQANFLNYFFSVEVDRWSFPPCSFLSFTLPNYKTFYFGFYWLPLQKQSTLPNRLYNKMKHGIIRSEETWWTVEEFGEEARSLVKFRISMGVRSGPISVWVSSRVPGKSKAWSERKR